VKRTWDAIVIGGGQAGLAARYELAKRGIDHVVLEREAIAAKWRERWDSFTLVTPNWTVKLPGAEYAGPEPDGFLPRDEIVAHLESYASLPGGEVVTGVEATEVTASAGGGYRVDTNQGPYEAKALIVATGTFQKPKRPAAIGHPSSTVLEVHSSDYRNPDQLPAGGVLIIGSAQTGMQLADELLAAGRRVFISTGKAGRMPRRYRGADAFRWFERLGYFEQPVEALPSLASRASGNPHNSGKGGGRTLNLHKMARDGAVILGRLVALDGQRADFAADRDANVAFSDEYATKLRSEIDKLIADHGANSPEADPADDYWGTDAFSQPDRSTVDLVAEGISSVIWSAGYSYDFSWIRPARLDVTGYPIQRSDYADSDGLYFLGMHFLHWRKSGIFYGVGDEAEAIARQIAA
jgi:putative flavoprotein involved in K+ transport